MMQMRCTLFYLGIHIYSCVCRFVLPYDWLRRLQTNDAKNWSIEDKLPNQQVRFGVVGNVLTKFLGWWLAHWSYAFHWLALNDRAMWLDSSINKTCACHMYQSHLSVQQQTALSLLILPDTSIRDIMIPFGYRGDKG